MLIIKNNAVKKLNSEECEKLVNCAGLKNGIGVFETVKVVKTENETATGEYLDYYALKDLLIRNFCILNSH